MRVVFGRLMRVSCSLAFIGLAACSSTARSVERGRIVSNNSGVAEQRDTAEQLPAVNTDTPSDSEWRNDFFETMQLAAQTNQCVFLFVRPRGHFAQLDEVQDDSGISLADAVRQLSTQPELQGKVLFLELKRPLSGQAAVDRAPSDQLTKLWIDLERFYAGLIPIYHTRLLLPTGDWLYYKEGTFSPYPTEHFDPAYAAPRIADLVSELSDALAHAEFFQSLTNAMQNTESSAERRALLIACMEYSMGITTGYYDWRIKPYLSEVDSWTMPEHEAALRIAYMYCKHERIEEAPMPRLQALFGTPEAPKSPEIIPPRRAGH